MGQLSVPASRFLWAVVLFALLGTFFGLQAYRANTCKGWPVTEGVVVAYYGKPNYRYSVGGVSHIGTRVSCNEFFLGRNSSAAKNGDRYLATYPLGGSVKVHYDPGRPEIAVLETNFDSGILKVIGVILLVCLLCAVGFKQGWRWRVIHRRSGVTHQMLLSRSGGFDSE